MLLSLLARHSEYFWTSLILGPTVLLIDFAIVWNGIQRFRDYSVSVEAEVVDVLSRRSGRSNAYRPLYALFYEGETVTLPDVSWSGFRYCRPGQQRTVRINPKQPDAVFDPKTYWVRIALWTPVMIMFTVFACSGFTM